MKRIYIIVLVLLVFSTSCTKNFLDFNTDSKSPSSVEGEYFVTQAQKELVDQISSTNVNWNIWKLVSQYWTETTYIDEANYDIINRNIPEQVYRAYYRNVLKPLDEATFLITEDPITLAETEAQKQNKLLIIDLLEVYVYQNLVNIFGDVPYSEAVDFENITPVYDDAAGIYADLLTRVDAAIAGLDVNEASYGMTDHIYGGDVAAWVKFAYSLKCKLAINLADVSGAGGQAAFEAAYADAFTSGADNALFAYESAPPNANPLYDDLVASGRKDFVPANTIVDAMVALNDPRLPFYFQDQIDGVWVGGEYGYSNTYTLCSHINDNVQAATFPGILMTYSEVMFYVAEAAERGWSVGMTAAEAYAAAVQASFDFWGAGDATAYLAGDGAYADMNTIAEQSWIAAYTRGLVAYNTYRRLDYPMMNVASVPETGGPVPTRFTYPVNEQTLNADNYYAAATAIGGDDLLTLLFWDAVAP